jgi:hypothetical protein
LLKINVDRLNGINAIADVMMATLHTNQLVKAGADRSRHPHHSSDHQNETIQAAEAHCDPNDPVVSIRPVRPHPTGLITTGSEVYHQRIEDKFGPVVIKKMSLARQPYASADICA